MIFDDPMWDVFHPLWSDLMVVGNQIQVVGGYGLFLKQRWLFANRNHPTAVPLENWRDTTPRVTNDLDIVIGLELLASAKSQGNIVQAMVRNGCIVVEKNP